jgi:hypothetical protein
MTHKPANRFIQRARSGGSTQTLRRLIRDDAPFIEQNHAIGNFFHLTRRVRREQ